LLACVCLLPAYARRGSRGYNAADYAHLSVPEDVRELFQYIGRYKPHNIALDTKLKCFIPDYIPSVGEMDAFIKVWAGGAVPCACV
jgi:hypothetical protein